MGDGSLYSLPSILPPVCVSLQLRRACLGRVCRVAACHGRRRSVSINCPVYS